ncbi:GNAT family N-acetyltransferase [Vacuolonema iberomarrocanum]|uniref:GNAT family N-acetyltransferase n=1 Tax=Vacuolonema iberomarrocanum TaxID=3454632 RepID=UPI0019FFDD0B|nr:GNAT family N-acetyltransferase [filamentous cyanobacterium LEGE 07170]
MTEYRFTKFTASDNLSALALLEELPHGLTEANLEFALANQYQIFLLKQESQLVGLAGIHVYPHLTDTNRAWIHDLITIKNQEPFELQSMLLASLRDQCLNRQCPELAIHILINNAIANQFFLREAGQPFAFVYEWSRSSWLSSAEQVPTMNDFQCREIKTLDDMASGLVLLTHFHPTITQISLADAMARNYRLFGLWMDEQLCSIATLIAYPHLNDGMCVWLQDGMTLPTRNYKAAASRLLFYILNDCFRSGYPTVTVHTRVSSKRTHRFYEAAGGYRIANAYKWKIDA